MPDARTEPYRRELETLLKQRGQVHPSELFRDVTDDCWLWINTDGRTVTPALSAMLPGLPTPRQQMRWTGASGHETQVEGFEIYRTLRDVYQRHFGTLRAAGPILDFGCGWGRVIRFFLKDVGPGQLFGTDHDQPNADYCIESNPWCQFGRNDANPPLPYGDGEMGFVYAYSVFSHFSEPMHRRWLEEFKRILRPGGALALTLRPRRFIEHTQHLRAENSDLITAGMFLDAEAELERYDSGEFCFSPYNPDIEGGWWGEACIPREYVEQHWSQLFDVLEFVPAGNLMQHVVLLRA